VNSMLLKAWLLIAMVTGVATAGLVKADQTPLILAVHPYLPTPEIVTRFTPLADYLSAVLGRPVEVRVGRTYDEHIEAVGADRVDLAFVGPVPYITMVRKFGHKPLLARLEIDGAPTFLGYIVTREDSPIHTLADLKGKSFAFGDRNSTMGHVVPHFVLHEAGVDVKDLSRFAFLGAHNNVALAVLAGDMDAGALKDEAYAKYRTQGLRVLAQTPPISEHVFVANSKMSSALIVSLRKALLDLKSHPRGAEIMRRLNDKLTGMVAVKDADYDSLRTIVDTVAHLRD